MTPVAEADRHLTPTLRIRPTKGWAALNLRELWSYRDLLWILVERNIKVIYKQTALGMTWVALQPLIAAIILAVVFVRVAKLPSDGVPYLLFVVALWFSALSVKYRDCNYALPFFLQIWMYASAVVYPTSMIVSPRWQTLFALNPVVGFVEGFRWSVLGRSALNPTIFWVTVAMSLFILFSGAFFFRRIERSFADII